MQVERVLMALSGRHITMYPASTLGSVAVSHSHIPATTSRNLIPPSFAISARYPTWSKR